MHFFTCSRPKCEWFSCGTNYSALASEFDTHLRVDHKEPAQLMLPMIHPGTYGALTRKG